MIFPMWGVGYQDMDHNYDWSEYVGQYNHPFSIWNRFQAENLIDQRVTVDSAPEGLNTEQRKIYDTVVNQYVALLTTCAKLQELAAANRKQNPVFRAAPTGIAAYAIMGKTLHSLLRLPVKGKMSDLSTATLQSLQACSKMSVF
jgi:hypothetical protein